MNLLCKALLINCFLLNISLKAQTPIENFQINNEIYFETSFLENWAFKEKDSNVKKAITDIAFTANSPKKELHLKVINATNNYFQPNFASHTWVTNHSSNIEGATSLFEINDSYCKTFASADWCVEYMTVPKERFTHFEHMRVSGFYKESTQQLILAILLFDKPEDAIFESDLSIFKFK